mmetsp:Transcript_8938/g.35042  ORF Transcript_8938/g.35042 Transcript_8938/m.35042 type:complete len:292 (+) Transcript_8938:525-1400(+)
MPSSLSAAPSAALTSCCPPPLPAIESALHSSPAGPEEAPVPAPAPLRSSGSIALAAVSSMLETPSKSTAPPLCLPSGRSTCSAEMIRSASPEALRASSMLWPTAEADMTAARRASYSCRSRSACCRHRDSASATARLAASSAIPCACADPAARAVTVRTGAAATRMQRSANLSVDTVSLASTAMGPMVATTQVSALPPRLRESSLVSFESRNGTCRSEALPRNRATSESFAMTLPRAASEELMARASSRRAPVLDVRATRSLPARSTRVRRPMVAGPPAALACLTVTMRRV